MANPIVQPLSPLDSTSATKSIYGKYSLVLDDSDSSINRTTVNVQGYYSSIDSSTHDFDNRIVANFRDTGANPTKQISVDVAAYSDNRIELTVADADGDFNSAIFFVVDNEFTEGCSFTFRLSIPVSSTTAAYTARPYYPVSTFTGVSAGLFDLSTGNAVLLLFEDSSTVTIAGPASDGAGTRATTSVTYNWSIESTYSIFIDYKTEVVTVTATTTESNTDVVLFSGTLGSLGVSLNSLSMANKFITDHDNLIAFVSQDGREIGDTAIIHDFEVCPFSYRYVTSGLFTKHSKEGLIESRDAYLGEDPDNHNFLEWSRQNVTLYKSAKNDAMEFTAANGFVQSDYADLVDNKFFMYVRMHTTENTFSGINAGIGIDIMGSKQFSIRFLDNRIGIRLSNSASLVRSYTGYATHPIDITVENYFIFYSDGTTLRAYIGLMSDTRSNWQLISTVPVSSLPASSETCVRFVSEIGTAGILFVDDFVFSATTNSYIIGTTNTTTTIPQGSFTYPISGPSYSSTRTNYAATAAPSIAGEYITINKYNPEYSGVTCMLHVILRNIAFIQPGTNHGPFLIVNSDKPSAGIATHGLRLMITKGNDGSFYMYFPGDPQDSREVAFQTNKGKSISVKLELDNPRIIELDLCIRYVPTVGATVYDVAKDFTPLLTIPEADIDGSHQLLPNINSEGVYLPVDVAGNNTFTAAVGVLEPGPVLLGVKHLFVCTGRGADVSFFKDDNKIPAERLYGSRSRLLVTAEDND